MTLLIITYKINSQLKGLVCSYLNMVSTSVYIGTHNKGFIDKFIIKFKDMVKDTDKIILIRKENNINGYSIEYFNMKDYSISDFDRYFLSAKRHT